MTSPVGTRVFETVELAIDVTGDAAIGMPARTAVTVHLPAVGALSSLPVVCFAFPFGGYSRRYYTTDLLAGTSTSTGTGTGQAGWHARMDLRRL